MNSPAVILASLAVVIQLIAPGLVIFDIVEWSVDQLAFVESFVVALSGVATALFVKRTVS